MIGMAVLAGCGWIDVSFSLLPFLRQFAPVTEKKRGEGIEAKMIKGVMDKVLAKSGRGEMNVNKVSFFLYTIALICESVSFDVCGS